MSEEYIKDTAIPTSKIDPTKFDVTINAFLIGLGAEKYIEIFRKNDIGQCTLTELANEDLIKLGVDDADVRNKLLDEVKNLPIYKESLSRTNPNLGPSEIVDIFEESSQHLHRISLSMLANMLALKKSKAVSDCLVYQDKYSSDIALSTLSEITSILNSMDIALHTQLKVIFTDSNSRKKKKIIVGTAGSVVIAILAVFFARSLKQLV